MGLKAIKAQITCRVSWFQRFAIHKRIICLLFKLLKHIHPLFHYIWILKHKFPIFLQFFIFKGKGIRLTISFDNSASYFYFLFASWYFLGFVVSGSRDLFTIKYSIIRLLYEEDSIIVSQATLTLLFDKAIVNSVKLQYLLCNVLGQRLLSNFTFHSN